MRSKFNPTPLRARARSRRLPLTNRPRSMRARQSHEPRTRLISTSLYSLPYLRRRTGIGGIGFPKGSGLIHSKQRSGRSRRKTPFRSCRWVAIERYRQSSHRSLRSLGALLWRPRPAFASPGAAYLGRAVANRTDHSPLPCWTSLLEPAAPWMSSSVQPWLCRPSRVH